MTRKKCKHEWEYLPPQGHWVWCNKCGAVRTWNRDWGAYSYKTPKTMVEELSPWEQNKGIKGKPARRKV